MFISRIPAVVSLRYCDIDNREKKQTSGDSIVASCTDNEVKVELLLRRLDTPCSYFEDWGFINIHEMHVGSIENVVIAVLKRNSLATKGVGLGLGCKFLL